MEKMLIKMSTLEDARKIVNSAQRLTCQVDISDGAHVVDAKKLVGVVSLNPASKITVTVYGDHDDYRNLAMWLKDLYVGKLVDIYADTPEADAIMRALQTGDANTKNGIDPLGFTE